MSALSNLAQTCEHVYALVIPILYRYDSDWWHPSALSWALFNDLPVTFRRVVDAGFDVPQQQTRVMIKAAQNAAEHIMEILLNEWKLSPNIFDRVDSDSRTTPLFRAISWSRHGDETVGRGHPGLVRLLLRYGANPSQASFERRHTFA